MDEKTLRYQCLQTAHGLSSFSTNPDGTKPTADAVLALAAKLYAWVTTGVA